MSLWAMMSMSGTWMFSQRHIMLCKRSNDGGPVPKQVDGHLRTSDPDVYAVGDIAAFPLKRYNSTTRQVRAPVFALLSWAHLAWPAHSCLSAVGLHSCRLCAHRYH